MNNCLHNKRGLINDKRGLTNFIFGLIGMFILILVLVTLLPVKYGHMDINQAVDTLQRTQNNLSFSDRIVENPETDVMLISNVLYKFVDFVVYSAFEISKLAIIVADKYLGTSGIKLLFLLIFVSLLSALVPIIFGLIKLCLVLFVLTAEYFSRKKDKQKIDKLKRSSNKNGL